MTTFLTAALFDVDGTLVDSNYLHVSAWSEALAQAGYDVPMAAIHQVMGMGSGELLDALLPADRDPEVNGAISAAHSALYAAHRNRLRPFARAADLLRACKSAGMRVVLATSAEPAELARLRDVLDADDAIDEVVSGSEAGTSKPAPDLVQLALDRIGAGPGEAVFVGDTVWDVQACQRAGVRCIAVRCGGVCSNDLLDAGAVAVYADPSDLLESTAGDLTTAVADGEEATAGARVDGPTRLAVLAAIISDGAASEAVATATERALATALSHSANGSFDDDARSALARLLRLASDTPGGQALAIALNQTFLLPDDSHAAGAREEHGQAFADLYRRLAMPSMRGQVRAEAALMLSRLTRLLTQPD
ncbi:MAG TPA: HAD family hydrolase [Streptosporangiaceae bacterium]|jgi:HAD superfamily hydrolase (TIGR01509 family)